MSEAHEYSDQPATMPLPAKALGFGFYEKIPLTIVIWGEILGCIVAVIVNPMTIKAMVNGKLLNKTVSNLFILSLCASDFLFGASYLVVKVIHLLQLNGFADDGVLRVLSWVCSALVTYCFMEGLLAVIVIGVDRAVATAKPLNHRRLLTMKRGLVVVLFAWTYNWLICFPPIIIMVVQFDSLSELPVLHNPARALPPSYIRRFTTPYFTSLFIICGIIYGLVIIFYIKAKKRINSSGSSERKVQRMTKMIIAIVGVLFFCNFPVVIMVVFSSTIPMQKMWQLTLYEVTQFLGILPIFVNNFMYAWHIDYYKAAYLKLLCCKKAKSDVIPPPSTTAHAH